MFFLSLCSSQMGDQTLVLVDLRVELYTQMGSKYSSSLSSVVLCYRYYPSSKMIKAPANRWSREPPLQLGIGQHEPPPLLGVFSASHPPYGVWSPLLVEVAPPPSTLVEEGGGGWLQRRSHPFTLLFSFFFGVF